MLCSESYKNLPTKGEKYIMKNNLNGVKPKITFTINDEWNEEELAAMCEFYGFTCEFWGETMFIKTNIGKWKFDVKQGSSRIKLYHYNMFVDRRRSRKFSEEYHLHEKRYSSPAEAIRYIYAHDRKGYSYMRYSRADKVRMAASAAATA